MPASDPRIDLSADIQRQKDAIAAGTHVFYRNAFMELEAARQIGYAQ